MTPPTYCTNIERARATYPRSPIGTLYEYHTTGSHAPDFDAYLIDQGSMDCGSEVFLLIYGTTLTPEHEPFTPEGLIIVSTRRGTLALHPDTVILYGAL